MADQDMMADDQADQAADTDEATPDTTAGYCIEIHVSPDGKVSVGVEPKSAEDEETDEENYQPVGSFAEAIKLAKEIYAHAGNMEDVAAGQDDMAAGYGKQA
jgi:hypothetical protein